MRIWTALCGIAFAAGLAACGGGGGGSAGSTPSASTPTTGSGSTAVKGIDTPSAVSIVSPTN